METPQKWQMLAPMLVGADIPPLDEFRYYFLPSKFIDIVISLVHEYSLEYHYLNKTETETTNAQERINEFIRMCDPVMPCGELILFDMRTTVKAGGAKWVQYTFDGIDWIDLYQIIDGVDGTDGTNGTDGEDATCEDCAGQEYAPNITDIGCYTRAASTIWDRFKKQMETVATQTETFASFRRDALLKFNRFDEYEIAYDGSDFYEWDMLWRDDSMIFDPAMDSLTAIVLDPDTNPVGHNRCYQTFIAHLTKLAMGQTVPSNDVWNDTGQWVEDRAAITDIDTEEAGYLYGLWAWELLAHAWAVGDIVDEMRYLANQMERSETNVCQYDQADFEEWIGNPALTEWCYTIVFDGSNSDYIITQGIQNPSNVSTDLDFFGNESYRFWAVEIPFPQDANLTSVLCYHDLTAGTFDPVSGFGSSFAIDGGTISNYPITYLPSPFVWEGDDTVTDRIRLICLVGSERQAVGDATGQSYLTSVVLRGVGNNPFGGDNC